MAEPFAVSLTLDTAECVRGQSVPFRAVVSNASGRLLTRVTSLDPLNEALTLTVRREGRTVHATQLSSHRREGAHDHGPRRPDTTDLPPGGKLELADDLLAWFGELEPGEVEVTANYRHKLAGATSPPQKLRILPARPVWLSTPRYGQRLASAPLSAAWVHQLPAGTCRIFYQLYSFSLPGSPRRGLAVCDLPQPWPVQAATLAKPTSEAGHVYWQNPRGQLFAAWMPLLQPQPAAPVPIRLPFEAQTLASALSLPAGPLLLPVIATGRDRVALLAVDPAGAAETTEVPLGGAKPVGAWVNLWDYDARLHFAWATPGSREVHYTRLVLADRRAGWATPAVLLSDEPVLWLDGYVDVDAPLRGRPIFQEQFREPPPPKLDELPPAPAMLWAVTRRGAKLVASRGAALGRLLKPECSFALPGQAEWEVVSSVVTARQELALLLKSREGRLWYASTATRELRPLAELAGCEVRPDQYPGLLAGGEGGLFPWVYLRFADPAAGRIVHRKLEPAKEREPDDHDSAATAPAEELPGADTAGPAEPAAAG